MFLEVFFLPRLHRLGLAVASGQNVPRFAPSHPGDFREFLGFRLKNWGIASMYSRFTGNDDEPLG